MARIEQKAGAFEVSTYTDGVPFFYSVRHIETYREDDVVLRNMKTSDLHDLRYCIDRVLSQVEGLPGAR